MHSQLGVLAQAALDVVRAGKDSEQARIGGCLVIGILDQHALFTPGALQACWNGFPPGREGHEQRLDFVQRLTSEFFRDLSAPFNQSCRPGRPRARTAATMSGGSSLCATKARIFFAAARAHSGVILPTPPKSDPPRLRARPLPLVPHDAPHSTGREDPYRKADCVGVEDVVIGSRRLQAVN